VPFPQSLEVLPRPPQAPLSISPFPQLLLPSLRTRRGERSTSLGIEPPTTLAFSLRYVPKAFFFPFLLCDRSMGPLSKGRPDIFASFPLPLFSQFFGLLSRSCPHDHPCRLARETFPSGGRIEFMLQRILFLLSRRLCLVTSF